MNTSSLTHQPASSSGLFLPAILGALESVRRAVADQVGHPVWLACDTADEGQQWAALGVNEHAELSVPYGSLCCIEAGPGIPGFARVGSADGRRILCTILAPEHVPEGLRVLQAEAVAAFRAHAALGGCA